MLDDKMPHQVGDGPLDGRGVQLPLVRGDGVHAFGERRLRGQERPDQVVSRHLSSLRRDSRIGNIYQSGFGTGRSVAVRGVTGRRRGTLGTVNGV